MKTHTEIRTRYGGTIILELPDNYSLREIALVRQILKLNCQGRNPYARPDANRSTK